MNDHEWQQAYNAGRREASSVIAAFEAFLDEIMADECHHDDTRRGGSIWTICNDCGRKWADDKGGFPGYVEPSHITEARAALAEYREGL